MVPVASSFLQCSILHHTFYTIFTPLQYIFDIHFNINAWLRNLRYKAFLKKTLKVTLHFYITESLLVSPHLVTIRQGVVIFN